MLAIGHTFFIGVFRSETGLSNRMGKDTHNLCLRYCRDVLMQRESSDAQSSWLWSVRGKAVSYCLSLLESRSQDLGQGPPDSLTLQDLQRIRVNNARPQND